MTILNAAGEMVGPGGQVIGARELLEGARTALSIAHAQAQLSQELIRELEGALRGLLSHGPVASIPEDDPKRAAAHAILAQLDEVRRRAREVEQLRREQQAKAVQP